MSVAGKAGAMSSDDDCAAAAAPPGSSLAYAMRVLPVAKRKTALAVHAFCREVCEVAREVADPGVASLKLGWWRTEIAAAFEARAQHPVMQALVPGIAAFSLPRSPFDAIIEGVAIDLERRTYSDLAELEGHCRTVAGNAWLLCAEICGYVDAATRDYARELGVALQLTSVIRKLGADVRRGRLYVPRDELARFGVDAHELLRGRAPPTFAALMAHLAAHTLSRYAAALAALPAADRRAQRPLLIMAALGKALLVEIERDGFRVLDHRLALAPALKAWIALKAAWTP
jgi:phytoene synthase